MATQVTYGTWLQAATEELSAAGCRTPRLDALLLLELVTKRNRAVLLASGSEPLSVMRRGRLQKLIARRAAGEPLAYIVGQKEFYGRDFKVNKWVLVPRPESEAFLDILAHIRTQDRVHSLLDIGTGSGCLAITAKLQFPDMYVQATDISKPALHIAAQNALRHSAAIVFREQSLLHADKEGYDVLFANLPYVPTLKESDPSIAAEPSEALYGGPDGLELYRRLFEQLTPKHIRYVCTEALLEQHSALIAIAASANYDLSKTEGLVQLFVKRGNPYGKDY